MRSAKKIPSTGVPPTRETIAKRIARGWTEKEARQTPVLKMGIAMKVELRPYIYPKRDKWFGNVRGPGDKRIYLGTYESREAAQHAAELYIATGEKPPRRQRARRAYKPRSTATATTPRKKPKATETPAPRNERTQDRFAMMRLALSNADAKLNRSIFAK